MAQAYNMITIYLSLVHFLLYYVNIKSSGSLIFSIIYLVVSDALIHYRGNSLPPTRTEANDKLLAGTVSRDVFLQLTSIIVPESTPTMHWIICIVACSVLQIVSAQQQRAESQWKTACPLSCSCSLSELRDLPIYRWFLEDTDNKDLTRDGPSNEAHYDEDAGNSSKPLEATDLGLLRTAICIYQRATEAEEWMGSLPRSVQVLTILQALGSGQLTLRAEHFTQFSSLIALEIQGSPLHPTLLADDKPDTIGNIVIMSDTLRSMTSLQFLHLQHVRLLGQPEVAAKPTPLDNSKYLPSNGEPRDKDWKHKHSTMPHQLVFLSAADPLPYDEYKVAQEIAGLSLFRGLSNLLFLRVYQCGLKEIRWEMFDGLTKLLYLSLENNDLHYVPEFAFYGAPHLKTLSLAKNKLLNLQFTGFAGLLELEKLDLSNNNISHLSELSLPPMPKLKIADFRYNPIERIFASSFEIMNQTEIIYLGSNEAKLELKQSIWQGLSFLKRLSIFNAQAVQLENEILVGMPKLKELQIEGKIDALAFDAFLSVPKLETLVLKNCGITQVSMDTFLGLHGLVALDLSYNALSTLPPGIFDQLQSLKELQLQNNRLVELPEDIFMQLNAKLIRLEGNQWHCSCAMKEWRPMQINKVKVIRNSLQPVRQHSKSLVQVQSTQYVFEKRVAPKCKTPLKYQNWNVFHVLRKELRCGKPKMLHLRKIIKTKAPDMTTPVVNLTSSEASTLPPTTVFQQTTAAPEQEIQAVEDNNPIDTVPIPNETEELDPNELQVLPSNMREQQPEPHLKVPMLPTNSFVIQHQGQQLKVSKKAYKFELERIRSEKLRNVQAMSQ